MLTKTRQTITQSADNLKILLEDIFSIIIVLDEYGIVQYETESVESVLGYTVEESLGKNICRIIHPEHKSLVKQKLFDCANINLSDNYFECMVKHKSGSWRCIIGFLHNLSALSSEDGILLIVRDTTELHLFRERAVFYESFDTVTELPNREYFVNQLSRAINRAEKDKDVLSVLSIRIQNFYDLHNIYGYSFGNKLLKEIGLRLRNIFRNDDLVCRFERAIFMVLLNDIYTSQSTEIIFQKAVNAFSEKFIVDGKEIKIFAAMGGCFYPQDGKTVDAIIQNSQAAMNTAIKNGGETLSLFNEKQNKETIDNIQIGHDLKDAVPERQIIVHYQPKVNREREIVGMEALARWDSPTRGLVYPDEFIPVAEKNKIIKDIDRYVLEECCSFLNLLNCGVQQMPIAVNVSSQAIMSETFVSDVKCKIEENKIDCSLIELEITETGLIENEKECIKKLSVLHELGIKIAIDDFGIGHSSLSRLKDYPVDMLKIDRSFIINIFQSKRSRILVNSIINLAHDLGFMIVVEGVETDEQFEYLRERNCELYQGYLFGKPQSMEYFLR